jgi:hypothetical protein
MTDLQQAYDTLIDLYRKEFSHDRAYGDLIDWANRARSEGRHQALHTTYIHMKRECLRRNRRSAFGNET